MSTKGVALIVVHGVADQQPGATARALVDLLVATEGGSLDNTGHADQIDYAASAREDFVLTVEPLAPRQAPAQRVDVTPSDASRPAFKAGLQSVRSDFRRRGWKAAATLEAATSAPYVVAADADRGIAATDYLLAKHRDNGAGPEAYETSCIRVERRAAGSRTDIAVYEMYWADLSRLSGALPRIVTELFTMVFRLSQLGRDTVDEAHHSRRGAAYAGSWRVTNATQIALDWLFANVLAPLFAQLLLLAIVFAALGLATLVEARPLVHLGLAGAVAILGVLVFAYHRDAAAKPALWGPPLLLALTCFAALVLPPLRPWVSGLLLIAGITLVYDLGLRIAADRFPFVRIAGLCLWASVVGVMLLSAVHEVVVIGSSLDPETFDVGWHAAIFGVELTLLLIKWWWIVAGILLVVWFVSGSIASLAKGYESRASLATGRLGLALSLVTFLTLTMAIWALLSSVIDMSARNVVYSPCIFAFDEEAAKSRAAKSTAAAPPAYPPVANRCLWRTGASFESAVSTQKPSAASGGLFLNDRYLNSTASFSVLGGLLLLLIAYLAAMFTPSIFAELKLLARRARDKAHRQVERHRRESEQTKQTAEPATPPARQQRMRAEQEAEAERGRIRRLGRWLTAGFRRLDLVVFLIAAAGVAAGLIVAGLFLGDSALGLGAKLAGQLQAFALTVSQNLLKPLVLTAAGIAATLTLLGGLLSKYLPELRAPLDVALDVDNHFREFPRTGIPRARIFSRYAALLDHVSQQGHERIVIVAHSQGTVISAELLRFLSSSGGQAPAKEHGPLLDGKALPAIGLLTLGCPLRQLYAARFPTLYRWVIARRGGIVGPRAYDIGVARWINAFCSGDYVGRWLWSDSPDDKDPVGHPMVDTVDPKPFGRSFAYDGFDPMPPLAQPFDSAEELEVCLGVGAHTHYLETDQVRVAWLVDSLIQGRNIAPSGHKPPPSAEGNIETP